MFLGLGEVINQFCQHEITKTVICRSLWIGLTEANVLSRKHRVMKKNFQTEMRVNNRKLPLNHFVQETLANMIVGFLRTLKETEEFPDSIEIKISKLPKVVDVDAHTYP
jgi:hypothetical protein